MCIRDRCFVILGVFRLKLTLLTAHLHLFLFLRRKSFGRRGCLSGLDQLLSLIHI